MAADLRGQSQIVQGIHLRKNNREELTQENHRREEQIEGDQMRVEIHITRLILHFADANGYNPLATLALHAS